MSRLDGIADQASPGFGVAPNARSHAEEMRGKLAQSPGSLL